MRKGLTISLSQCVTRNHLLWSGHDDANIQYFSLGRRENNSNYKIKINLYSSNCESTVRQPNEKRAAFYPIRHDRQLLYSTLLFFWEPPAAVLIVHESPELLLVVQHVNWAVGGGSTLCLGLVQSGNKKAGRH